MVYHNPKQTRMKLFLTVFEGLLWLFLSNLFGRDEMACKKLRFVKTLSFSLLGFKIEMSKNKTNMILTFNQ